MNGSLRMSISRVSGALIFSLALLSAVSAQAADTAVSAAKDVSKPFVVKIHADWCGTCRMLEPTLTALDEKMGPSARVVVLDVTDRGTYAAAAAEAKRLGIESFFDRYKSRTGIVGVLDGSTREIIAVLSGELDITVYERALTQARKRTGT